MITRIDNVVLKNYLFKEEKLNFNQILQTFRHFQFENIILNRQLKFKRRNLENIKCFQLSKY